MINKRTFEIIDTEIVEHYDPEKERKENLVSQINIAKHSNKNFEAYFIVAACHLKANTPQGTCSDTRARQANQLIEVIEKKKQKYLELNGNKKENICIIVCGDFNDFIHSECMQNFLTNKDFQLQSAFPD